jgi:pyroglutamyl-peptidase
MDYRNRKQQSQKVRERGKGQLKSQLKDRLKDQLKDPLTDELKERPPLSFKFIVTGFNRFGENLENPSGLTARSLPSELALGHHKLLIESLVLQTCCENGWSSLHQALKKKNRKVENKDRRSVLILMGLAATRESLNIERFALNVRDYAIKDNCGHHYDGEEIMPGPLALATDFPLKELRKNLLAKGFPCTISNNAGTFVCNDLYYKSLSYKQKLGTPDLVLFIHVPKANVFARSVREKGSKKLQEYSSSRLSKAKQIELLRKAVIEVMKFTVHYLQKEEDLMLAERPTRVRLNNKNPSLKLLRRSSLTARGEFVGANIR